MDYKSYQHYQLTKGSYQHYQLPNGSVQVGTTLSGSTTYFYRLLGRDNELVTTTSFDLPSALKLGSVADAVIGYLAYLSVTGRQDNSLDDATLEWCEANKEGLWELWEVVRAWGG